MATIDVVIVGAGSGMRLGGSMPKAFVDLCGKPLFYYSLITFLTHRSINRIILVVSETMTDVAKNFIDNDKDLANKVSIAVGDDERWKSVRNGILSSKSEWTLIHDAARPFVTLKVIDSVLGLSERFDCAVTAVPEVDTIRVIKDESRCGGALDRSKLLRVGTPQLFRRLKLLSSFDRINACTTPPTDEAALFESLGMEVGYSWGDSVNFKITTGADLEIARAIIERERRLK